MFNNERLSCLFRNIYDFRTIVTDLNVSQPIKAMVHNKSIQFTWYLIYFHETYHLLAV